MILEHFAIDRPSTKGASDFVVSPFESCDELPLPDRRGHSSRDSNQGDYGAGLHPVPGPSRLPVLLMLNPFISQIAVLPSAC